MALLGGLEYESRCWTPGEGPEVSDTESETVMAGKQENEALKWQTMQEKLAFLSI